MPAIMMDFAFGSVSFGSRLLCSFNKYFENSKALANPTVSIPGNSQTLFISSDSECLTIALSFKQSNKITDDKRTVW